jgi:hypothetical protein
VSRPAQSKHRRWPRYELFMACGALVLACLQVWVLAIPLMPDSPLFAAQRLSFGGFWLMVAGLFGLAFWKRVRPRRSRTRLCISWGAWAGALVTAAATVALPFLH